MSNLDSKTYRKRDNAKALADQEREKKRKYLRVLEEQRRHFTPFVVSCDGMLGKEADFMMKRLAQLLSEKWQRPYSQVCGYLKARMSIAIVRATHMCIRGSRVPSRDRFARMQSQNRAHMEDGAGIGFHGY